MNSYVSVGVGAGLVSALLIAVVVKATPLALLLYILAPIPILIASLGWDSRAGLVGAAAGGAVIALAFSPFGGLGFVLATALPAWWLAYLALLGQRDEDGAMDWYPLGRLLGWIAGTAAITLVAAAILSSGGDYDAFRNNTREIARTMLRVASGPSPELSAPGESAGPRDQLAENLAILIPALAAQGLTLVLAFHLWAAGKVVHLSGRLVRPWPFIPGVAMPRIMLLYLAGAVALMTVGGFPGAFGAALAGALVAAFALQGLAAIHDRSRGKSGRLGLLIGTYLLLFLSQGAALLALMLFGLADTALGLRRSPRAGDAGPTTP